MLKTFMLKQTLQKSKKHVAKLPFIVMALILLSVAIVPKVSKTEAQSVQDQINKLQSENAGYRSEIDRLRGEATSYEDAISSLQAAISTVQGQIAANTAEQERLQREIDAAEAELVKQKRVLGENIKAMYLERQISTLEMLASSKDLSEFVDKEQYRNSVKDKVKSTLDKITTLKHDLNQKKQGVEELLKQQKAQEADLGGKRAEQANLLAYNESQRADFNQKTKDNQSKIDSLIASQRRANFNPDGGYYFLRFPGTVKGFSPDAYPYKNAGFGMSPGPGCVDNDGPDPWGYCTRQCVSYAAWAVLASGRSAPTYYGNAKDWVAAAYARGVPVYRTPQPGDIAISTAGYWGHAMYVESVSGSSFRTSEYNTNLDGRLTYQTRSY